MDNELSSFLSSQPAQFYGLEFMNANSWIFNDNALVDNAAIESWWWRSYTLYQIPHRNWREKLPDIQKCVLAFVYFNTSNSTPF